MNKKWIPYIIIALLIVAIIVAKQYQGGKKKEPKRVVTNNDKPKPKPGDPASNTDRDKGFDRRTTYLEYSNHAKCRMQCRRISQAEVEEIMRDGKINYNKSDLKSRSQSGSGCPRYAVEGTTSDDQRVRIVYAQCNNATTVVTVIDLGTDWTCDCPGDDDKYKNKR